MEPPRGPGPVGPRVGGGPLGPPGAVAPSCGPGLLRCARPRRPLRGALRAAPAPCALPRRASPAPPCSLGLSRRSWRRVLACSASAAGRRSLPRGRSLARAVAAWPRPSPGSARPPASRPLARSGGPGRAGPGRWRLGSALACSVAPGGPPARLCGLPLCAPPPSRGPLRSAPCGALPGPSGGRPLAARAPPAGRGWRPCGPPVPPRPARRPAPVSPARKVNSYLTSVVPYSSLFKHDLFVT